MRFLLGFLGGALAVLALSPASTRFTASTTTGARSRAARRMSARTRTAEEAARGRQRLAAYYRIHLN